MAIGVAGRHGPLTNAKVTWGGNDLSSFVRAVSLVGAKSDHPVGAMGNTAIAHDEGVEDPSATIEFYDTFYNNEVYERLKTDYLAGTAKALAIQPDKTAAISENNPSWSFTGRIHEFRFIDGTFDEQLMRSVTIRGSDGAKIAESVTP